MSARVTRLCAGCSRPLPAGASNSRVYCSRDCPGRAAEHRRRCAERVMCRHCQAVMLRAHPSRLCGFCLPEFDVEHELSIHSPGPLLQPLREVPA